MPIIVICDICGETLKVETVNGIMSMVEMVRVLEGNMFAVPKKLKCPKCCKEQREKGIKQSVEDYAIFEVEEPNVENEVFH